MLVDLPYNTCRARDQPNSAHEIFYEESIECAPKFMSNLMAPRAHSHIFRSELMFFHCNKSVCRQTEMVENLETTKGSKGKLSHVFEIKKQTFIYRKSSGFTAMVLAVEI